MRFKRYMLSGLLAVALAGTVLWNCRTARGAESTEVRDTARMFDPHTVAEVDAIVADIKKRFGKDLTIRTFPEVPEYMRSRFAAEEKEAFYEDWIREEARRSHTDGICILIVQKPGRLQIGVGNRTRTRAFTNADRDQLRDVMLSRFREKEFDKGLLAGAEFVRKRIERNQAASKPTTAATVPVDVQPATQPVGEGEKPQTRPGR